MVQIGSKLTLEERSLTAVTSPRDAACVAEHCSSPSRRSRG
jgi:hypothetical protein